VALIAASAGSFAAGVVADAFAGVLDVAGVVADASAGVLDVAGVVADAFAGVLDVAGAIVGAAALVAESAALLAVAVGTADFAAGLLKIPGRSQPARISAKAKKTAKILIVRIDTSLFNDDRVNVDSPSIGESAKELVDQF